MFGHETLGVIINTNYQSSMKILSENSSNSSSGCGGQGGGGGKYEVDLNKTSLFSSEN